MKNNEHGFRVPTENEDDEWVVVHQGSPTNTNPASLVEVTINAKPICPNMTNKEFRNEAMRARDIGVELIKHRIKAVALWDEKEQERAKTFFGRADMEVRNTLGARLPRLLRAMRELVPEKIVRFDSKTNRMLSCVPEPDSGLNHAAVCKPDSEKRVIALYSAYCQSPFGLLRGTCKIKTIIHECTHFTDTFNSQDWAYADKESSLRIYADNHPEKAIENADNITGYIANFDKVIL